MVAGEVYKDHLACLVYQASLATLEEKEQLAEKEV